MGIGFDRPNFDSMMGRDDREGNEGNKDSAVTTPAMKDVFSSHVNRIGYAHETQELHVQWDSGKTSVYTGVPKDVAESTMHAWSVGSALRDHVKPHYPHRYA